MKLVLLTITSAVILFAVLILSIWFSIPSAKDYEFIAKSATQYAPVFLDRNGIPLQTDLQHQSQSLYTPLDSLPRYFIQMLIFFEDQTFRTNPGINPARTVWVTILHILGDSHAGGASTITQQLVKLSTGYDKRSYWRKLVEIIEALKISLTMSKEQILELYLNRAPFGRYVGIGASARYYFGKTPFELTPAQSLLLISFLAHPPGDVMKNLNRVYFWYHERVKELLASGKFSVAEPMFDQYFADPVFKISPVNQTEDGIFVDRANENAAKELLGEPHYGLDYSGLTVVTTLDKATNDTVQDILENAVARYPGSKGSFVLLNRFEQPVVYTASYPTERGDFDLINANGSMPASRMKFPIYTLLIEKLRSTKNMTGREIFRMMLPTSFKVSEHFTVRDGFHEAYVPLYRAFALSSNAAAYFILNRILSPMFVVDRLRMFDLHLLPYKSLALGSQPVSELRLAATYDAIVLRNGFYKQPSFVTRILNKSGEVIYQDDENLTGRQEVSSESCRIAKELLREASDVGTTHALSGLKILAGHDFGAKTGTTERDKQLGVTGFLDRYCFSLHLESDKSFPGESEAVAVPILTKILTLLVERGY